MKKHNILKVALWIVPVIILLLAVIFPTKGWVYLVNLVLSLAELAGIIFSFKDEHNTNKVLLATIGCFLILSWLIPAAYFSSKYIEQGRVQMGLFDLVNYPVTAVSYFGYITFYVLCIGAFYGVLNKIPAYRSFLDRILMAVKGTEKFVLFIIMLVLAVLTSLGGMQLTLLCFFPMLVSLILLMGFDKMVAALTLVGSTMIGIAGTTYGYSNISMISSTLGVELTSEVATKIVILVLGIVLLYVNTLLYIKKNISSSKEANSKKIKVEKTTTKASKTSKSSSKKNTKAAVKKEEVIVVTEDSLEKNDLIPSASKNSKHSIWPFVVSFVILFVIAIMAFIPWSQSFGVSTFDDATTAVSKFKLFGFQIFAKLFGTFNAFGYWTVVDFLLVLLAIATLLVILYKVKVSDVLEGMFDGIKKALPLGIVVILVYTCLVMTTYHPFQLRIYKALLGLVDKFNFGTSLVVSSISVLASIFNADPSYTFQSVLPYLATIITDQTAYPEIAIIFQSMYGFTMLFAPTSLVLMLTLSYLDINYSKWLKNIWKLLLEFLVVILIVLAIVIIL